MKPTPQIDSDNRRVHGEASAANPRTFPLTDYSFQTASKTFGNNAAVAKKKMAEVHTFRRVSRDFFGAEMTRDCVTEGLFFVSMTCVAAWPMAVTLHQLLRWMI